MFDAIGKAFSAAVDTIGDIAKVAAPVLFPGPTLAMTAFNLVSGAIGEGVNGAAKQLCQEFGMPKFLQDVIGKIVDQVLGQNRQPSNPECDRHCGNDRGVGEAKRDFVQDFIKSLVEAVRDGIEDERKCGGGGKGGGASSWLVALAKALGEVAGQKAADMVKLSEKITELNGGGEDKAKEAVTAQNELNGLSKEFQQFMEMINNVVKGIGDGLTSVARK